MSTTKQSPIVAFHIGRGGRFHNQGFLSYCGERNIEETLSHFADTKWYFIRERNEQGQFCTPCYVDGNGNHLIDLKEAKTGVGTLNWDNDYDTDYCKHIEDCDEKELRLIQQSNEYKSYDVQSYVDEYFAYETEEV